MIDADLILDDGADQPDAHALIVNDQGNDGQGLAAAIAALGVSAPDHLRDFLSFLPR